MSLLNLLFPTSPTLGGVEFDAVLEDTLELDVEITGYNIELGARVSDHRIVKPIRWRMVGVVTNTPFTLLSSGASLASGALSNAVSDSGLASAVLGSINGILPGSDDARGAATLEFLISLATTGQPFDVDTGDIQLKDMVIANLRRTKDTENENGLVFEADLTEFFSLSTAISKNQPNSGELNPDDPSASQASSDTNKGETEGSIFPGSLF